MRKLVFVLAPMLLAWLGGVLVWIWHGPVDEGARATSALVLDAAVADDIPSPVFAARIDHAIALWHEKRVRQIVFTGGKGSGDTLSEADAAKDYARARGIPASAIITETRSRTTRENLLFTLPGSLGQDIGSVLIVSDPLHLRRAMIMASDLGIDAAASPARNSQYRGASTRLSFALREVYFLHHYLLFAE